MVWCASTIIYLDRPCPEKIVPDSLKNFRYNGPMTGILSSAVKVFFFTDIWIFLYNDLLHFLNSKLPSTTSTDFIRVGAVPEPFEIPLYLVFIALIVVFLCILFIKLKVTKITQTSPHLKFVLVVFFGLVFISNLGFYPLAHDIYPEPTREKTLLYLLFFLISMFTAAVVVIEGALLAQRIEKNKKLTFGLFFFVACLIAFVTLDPHFDIYGHDYSYFFGPVWVMLKGKTIYTQTPSQYGFLSIFALALFHRLNLVNVLYLPVIVWFFYVIEYSLFFSIIYRVSKSIPLSLISLISLITINYLSIYHLPAMAPQVGPFRWLPLILSLFLFLRVKKIDSKWLIFAIAFLAFWVLDSGIFLLLAYGTTLLLLTLKRYISLKQFVTASFFLFASLIFIFLGINLFLSIFHYQLIDPLSIFSKLQEYSKSGVGRLPMDTHTYFWFVPLIYFASIIYIFKNTNDQILMSKQAPITNAQNSKHTLLKRLGFGSWDLFGTLGTWSLELDKQVLLFSANLSLFASIYFVGRSHPHNLFHISIFPLLTVFIFIGIILDETKLSRSKIVLLYSCFFLLFIAYPFYQRQEAITNLLKKKYYEYTIGYALSPVWIYQLKSQYKNEVKMIREELPEREIVILSPDDTYLFYLTQKENMINDNSQFTILTQKDIERSLEKVFKVCPKKIVAECSLFGKCQTREPPSFVSIAGFQIQPLLLQQVQERCNLNYRPIKCTKQLCIAENLNI